MKPQTCCSLFDFTLQSLAFILQSGLMVSLTCRSLQLGRWLQQAQRERTGHLEALGQSYLRSLDALAREQRNRWAGQKAIGTYLCWQGSSCCWMLVCSSLGS